MHTGRALITILLIVATGNCDLNGQTQKLDSMKNAFYQDKDDRSKLATLMNLAPRAANLHVDSYYHYVMLTSELARKLNDKEAELIAKFETTNVLAKKGQLDEAIRIVDSILVQYPKRAANKNIWIKFAMQKARFFDRNNQYTKSITQLYEVLNAAKQWNDTLYQVQAETGIGWIQLETEQYKEALKWFFQALSLTSNTAFLKEYSALYSNIASTYNKLGKNDSAEFYINKAIRYGRETESLTFLATSLNIAADIYISTNRPGKVEEALKESVKIRQQMDDPYYIVYDISRLANWYAYTGKTREGIELCQRGIELTRKSGLTSQLQLMYHALAENYKVSGNSAMYGATLEKIIALKDSFNSINSSNLLTALQAKFEVQEQENTIIQQKLNLSRKNGIIYVSLVCTLLAGVIALFIFREYRRRQRQKLLLMQVEEKRIAELAVLDAEEKERKRIAADLHDNLGAYANAVLHGTELLQQDAPREKSELVTELNNASKEIILSLRETIWALKKENYTAEECLLRIRNLIQSMNRYYENTRFEVAGNAPEYLVIHYTTALDIVRILREAISNAIKHSGADNITVFTEATKNDWTLRVVDDGKGFSPDLLMHGTEHHGLENIKERARVSHLGLNISSEPGRGTTVELKINTGKMGQK